MRYKAKCYFGKRTGSTSVVVIAMHSAWLDEVETQSHSETVDPKLTMTATPGGDTAAV